MRPLLVLVSLIRHTSPVPSKATSIVLLALVDCVGLDSRRQTLRSMPMTGTPIDQFLIDGKRYYHLARAAQIIGSISHPTVWRWANKGCASFGLALDVKREPIIHHRTPKTNEPPPKTARDFRLLLSEDSILALKELLSDHPIRPGPLSDRTFADLRAASHRYRAP